MVMSLSLDPEVVATARNYEPERYLAATLAPAQHRNALIALAAFAGDLRRIPATVKEPMLGEIRLQWWRDSLETLATGGRTSAPIADALGDAIAAYGLPVPVLMAMTEVRAFDLYGDAMPDQAALDGYLAKTEAAPFELALRVLGAPAGHAGALALAAGRAFGLTRLLAMLPAYLSRECTPLPATLLAQHEITSEILSRGEMTVAVRPLIDALAVDISATVATLRPQIGALPRAQRTALLPLATVAAYLRACRADTRQPLRDIADLAPLNRVWRIGWAHLAGRI
jgi:15-cis-phytoene synthase